MKKRHCLRLTLLSIIVLTAVSFPVAVQSQAHKQEEKEKWDVPLEPGKDGWRTYHNGRFGMVLPVPPGLNPTRPPDNGGGQGFQSADGKVSLVVYGHFNLDGLGDVEGRWKEALAEEGRTITYKRKTENWYVLSGYTKDGTGFYERYEANSKHYCGWRLIYPQADDKRYSGWVERIAKGFEPRLGKGEDSIE